MAKKVKVSDEESAALLVCVNELEKDDQFIRERSIRKWKKAEEYWRLNQFIYWDEVALDYRDLNTSPSEDENDDLAPKTFGIYRAYGESIIAAMSAAIPNVMFPADDTSNPEDITTSSVCSNISELIQKHNKAPLLTIKALSTLWNQGLIASHVYYDEDKKYGTRQVPKFKPGKSQYRELTCPQCDEHLGNAPLFKQDEEGEENEQSNTEEQDEQQGNEQEDQEHPYLKDYTCDSCGYSGKPELGNKFDEVFPQFDGHTEEPKGRVKIDIYGPLHVRINSYARCQDDVGLLELQEEMNVAAARDEFEDIADKIAASSDFYSYERWGRTSSELLSNTMYNQVTVRSCWLRPWAFQAYGKGEGKQDVIKKLKEKFPDGCCAIFVNDVFAEAYAECLDDAWTLSQNTLDSWLHALPLGQGLLDAQDAFNESENTNIQKQAFGILETFVGSDLINEDAYREQSNGPGYVTFVQSNPGEPISNQITQIKAANLVAEDMEFGDHFNTLGQFLVGAVPSIFGGNQVSGSKTATEYQLSRSYALQRLNNPWTIYKYFWASTIGKGVRLYIKNAKDDEKYTKKVGNTQQTVWIKKAELTGKIGDIEPEVSEQFPVSWAQRRDLMMQLITLQNPVVGEILLHPNNSQNVKDALGYSDFYVPGEADRTKQLIEIAQLINVSTDESDANHLPPNSDQPTVMPDADADDDNVHIQVIKLWLVGEEGLYTKQTNPAGYLNAVLHKRAHEANLQNKIAGPSDNTKPGEKPVTRQV